MILKIGIQITPNPVKISEFGEELLIRTIKLIQNRRETTNHPDYFYNCTCYHDELFHVNNKCKFKGCRCLYFKQNKVKMGGFAPPIRRFKPKHVNIVFYDLKSKEYWKSVELSLIEKGESFILCQPY